LLIIIVIVRSEENIGHWAWSVRTEYNEEVNLIKRKAEGVTNSLAEIITQLDQQLTNIMNDLIFLLQKQNVKESLRVLAQR
jgi:hypothetical protein